MILFRNLQSGFPPVYKTMESYNDADLDVDDDNVSEHVEKEDCEDEDADEDVSGPTKVSAKSKMGGKTKKASKPGIIYLSRIPQLMGPQRIKKIFSQYGEIGRVFLQPEDKFNRKARKKKGGSKARRFTEGWLEYMDKRTAKRVAITFNNTAIGGRRRSRHYEELWNVKYLHRFQWAHLAERLEYERQVRQQRVRTEISQAKRETNFFLGNVELGDKLDRLAKKKESKGKEWIARVRSHRQTVTQAEFDQKQPPKRSGKVSRDTLGKIFKKTSVS